jgi:hypothetical protein
LGEEPQKPLFSDILSRDFASRDKPALFLKVFVLFLLGNRGSLEAGQEMVEGHLEPTLPLSSRPSISGPVIENSREGMESQSGFSVSQRVSTENTVSHLGTVQNEAQI